MTDTPASFLIPAAFAADPTLTGDVEPASEAVFAMEVLRKTLGLHPATQAGEAVREAARRLGQPPGGFVHVAIDEVREQTARAIDEGGEAGGRPFVGKENAFAQGVLAVLEWICGIGDKPFEDEDLVAEARKALQERQRALEIAAKRTAEPAEIARSCDFPTCRRLLHLATETAIPSAEPGKITAGAADLQLDAALKAAAIPETPWRASWLCHMPGCQRVPVSTRSGRWYCDRHPPLPEERSGSSSDAFKVAVAIEEHCCEPACEEPPVGTLRGAWYCERHLLSAPDGPMLTDRLRPPATPGSSGVWPRPLPQEGRPAPAARPKAD